VALLHSGLEDVARTSAWLRPARATPASCSARASPCLRRCRSFGIGGVDEEHDTSFNTAEDCGTRRAMPAVYRAKLIGCPGGAWHGDPVAETWHNWRSGR